MKSSKLNQRSKKSSEEVAKKAIVKIEERNEIIEEKNEEIKRLEKIIEDLKNPTKLPQNNISFPFHSDSEKKYKN